jgi:hypothetical protein
VELNGREKIMAQTELTRELLEAAVLGASLLGGGGGGTVEEALEVGEMALKIGPLHLVDPDDLAPSGTVLTCSTVTCPHRKDPCITPRARCARWSCFSRAAGPGLPALFPTSAEPRAW